MKNLDEERQNEDLDATVHDVDRSLIREMLKLSVDERLQQLESHAALMQELRDANPALRLSQDS